MFQNLYQGILGEVYAWIHNSRDPEDESDRCDTHAEVPGNSWCHQVYFYLILSQFLIQCSLTNFAFLLSPIYSLTRLICF